MTTLAYKTIKRLARLFGFDISVCRVTKNGQYETVMVKATYAPWLLDNEFQRAFSTVKNFTLVDQYRCYELWQLVTESRKLNGALIEIGVWRGGTGGIIAKSAELSGINDTVYLCDTFAGVPKAGSMDSTYRGGEHADASEAKVNELLTENLNLTNTRILSGIFPEETAKLVNDDKFRFCHIDVDVYQSAKDIINWIWPKIVVGGFIVYDDYGFGGCDGITRFVNEERNQKDRIIIHNLNGHAIVLKIR